MRIPDWPTWLWCLMALAYCIVGAATGFVVFVLSAFQSSKQGEDPSLWLPIVSGIGWPVTWVFLLGALLISMLS